MFLMPLPSIVETCRVFCNERSSTQVDCLTGATLLLTVSKCLTGNLRDNLDSYSSGHVTVRAVSIDDSSVHAIPDMYMVPVDARDCIGTIR